MNHVMLICYNIKILKYQIKGPGQKCQFLIIPNLEL